MTEEEVEQILGHAPKSPADPVIDIALEVAEDVAKKEIHKLSRRKGWKGVVGSIAKTLWKKH